MKPSAALAVCATLSAAVLAGCVQSGTTVHAPLAPVHEPDWALKAIFGHADPDATGRTPQHDHANRTLHKGLSTPNFELVGHVDINSTYFGRDAGTTYCGDAAAPAPKQLAVTTSYGTDVGLTVLDVTDRAHPQVLGELVLPFSFTYDAALFADGKYAVIAANPDAKLDKPLNATADGQVPFHPMWKTRCGTTLAGSTVDRIPYGYATLLVDLSDPSNPKVADFYEYPAGRNVHSVSTAMIDGTYWVATSGLGALPCTVPGVGGIPPQGVPPPPSVPCQPTPRYGNLLSHFDFLTVEQSPSGPRLKPYAIYTPDDQQHLDPALLYLGNGHTDATIEKHPITNQTLAYLADWNGGLHIVRLGPTQAAGETAPDGLPGQAYPLASWGAAPGSDPTQNHGQIHSVRPITGTTNGHHYLITGQEVIGRPGARPSGQVDLLDVTDATHPIPRARWTLPVDVIWPGAWGEAFSTHYPIVMNGTLFVAMYHAGIWAADAHASQWPDLPSLGVYVPDLAPATDPVSHGNTPEVLEVLDLGDGTLLAFDADSGAYILRFHADDPRVPPAAPWPDTFIG